MFVDVCCHCSCFLAPHHFVVVVGSTCCFFTLVTQKVAPVAKYFTMKDYYYSLLWHSILYTMYIQTYRNHDNCDLAA